MSNRMSKRDNVIHTNIAFYADSSCPEIVKVWDIETAGGWHGVVKLFVKETHEFIMEDCKVGKYYLVIYNEDFASPNDRQFFEADTWEEVEEICLREILF